MYMYIHIYVIHIYIIIHIYIHIYICDTAQGKDAPRGDFLMLYAEY